MLMPASVPLRERFSPVWMTPPEHICRCSQPPATRIVLTTKNCDWICRCTNSPAAKVKLSNQTRDGLKPKPILCGHIPVPQKLDEPLSVWPPVKESSAPLRLGKLDQGCQVPAIDRLLGNVQVSWTQQRSALGSSLPRHAPFDAKCSRPCFP